MQIKYGPILLEKKEASFIEYLKYKLNKLIKINKVANKDDYAYMIKEIEDVLKGLL